MKHSGKEEDFSVFVLFYTERKEEEEEKIAIFVYL